MIPASLLPPPKPPPPGGRRALVVFAAVALGLWIGREAPWVGSAAWFSLCALVCAGAAVWRGKACRGAIFAACVLAGAGWYAVRIHEPAASGLGTLLSAEVAGGDGRTLVTVEGLV